jgi:hypothetical protein
MKNLKFLTLSMILALTLSFTYLGCSGGGGGGDDGNSGMVFSGLTTPAEINESNAEDLSGGAFGAGLIGDGMGDGMMDLSLDQGPNDNYIGKYRAVKVPLILSNSLDLVDFTASSAGGFQAALETATATLTGECGGTMSYTVSADIDGGDFNGSFTFSNYCNGGTTINGGASFDGRLDATTEELLEAHFSFDNLSGGELTLDGDIDMDFTVSPKIITFNAYGQDASSGKVYWIRDYSIAIDEDENQFPVQTTVLMDGMFYHPDHGYVELSTPVPIVLLGDDEWPTSGTLVVTGANNAKAKITAIDNANCTIEADIDGDDAYEFLVSATMTWDDV